MSKKCGAVRLPDSEMEKREPGGFFEETRAGGCVLTPRGERALSENRLAGLGFKKASDITEPSESDNWLIPGLVSSSRTLLYGETEAGKSFFVCNLVEALQLGKPFLDKTPVVEGVKSLIISTDSHSVQEYRQRLGKLEVSLDAVMIGGVDELKTVNQWSELAAYAAFQGVGFVVLDHANGVIGSQNTNEHQCWATLWNDYLGEFTRRGIAVLLVHHVSDVRLQGARLHRPQGNSAVSQYSRNRIELYTIGGKGNALKRKIRVQGNHVEPWAVEAVFEPEKGRFVCAEKANTATKRNRNPETFEQNERIAALAVESGATSKAGAARYIASHEQGLTVSVSTLERKKLKDLENIGLLAPHERGKPFRYGEKHPAFR